jgi:hypothetical protein
MRQMVEKRYSTVRKLPPFFRIFLEILSDAHYTCHHRRNSTALPPLDISSSHLQQNVGQLEAALAPETKRTGKAISDCLWAARLPDTAISGQPISINSACHSSVTAYFHGYWIRAADSLPYVPSRPLHNDAVAERAIKNRQPDRLSPISATGSDNCCCESLCRYAISYARS